MQEAKTETAKAVGERDEARRQIETLNENGRTRLVSHEAVKQLSNFVDEAVQIQQTFLQKNDPDLIAKQYTDWSAKVEGYLSDKLDSSYAAQFRNAHGDGLAPMNHNVIGGGISSELKGKADALVGITTELRKAQ